MSRRLRLIDQAPKCTQVSDSKCTIGLLILKNNFYIILSFSCSVYGGVCIYVRDVVGHASDGVKMSHEAMEDVAVAVDDVYLVDVAAVSGNAKKQL